MIVMRAKTFETLWNRMWLIKSIEWNLFCFLNGRAMVVRLLKRCHWCWFSFTSRLTLYYCVASPTVAAGTNRRHCQNCAPSAASYLPREKRQSTKHEIGQLRSKLALCNTWWLSRYPLSRRCYLFVGGEQR